MADVKISNMTAAGSLDGTELVPMVATEYIDNPEMTARHFNDGWFIPGDLGEFRDGLLLVTGRGGP